MSAVIETNRAVRNKKKLQENIYLNIKTTPPVTWFIDIMRQTLICIQGKQIFSITLIVHQNVY